MKLRRAAARLLPVLAAACLAPAATAGWTPRYFFFDRAAWSPDSRSIGVMGRFVAEASGESFEDTLLIDVETGTIRCATPSVSTFVLSRKGDRILGAGRWGLFDHDLRTGETRQILTRHPFRPSEIIQYSYGRDGTTAVCIRCPDEQPEISGVYAWPLAGGEPELMLGDSYCSAALLNFWQKHRRDIPVTPKHIPSKQRATVIDGFPGSVWQIDMKRVPGVAVWGNEPAPNDTLCSDCRTVFVSWPPGDGRALLSTAPENIEDLVTPGDLWLLNPGESPIHLGEGRFEECAWADSTTAVILARPGRLFRADLDEAALRPIGMSTVPAWLRTRRLPSAGIWTVRLDDERPAGIEAARERSLGLKDLGIRGFALDSTMAGSPGSLSVGVFPDSAGAAAAAGTIPGKGRRRIYERPASEMLGQFDFGFLDSPDGRWRLYFRSHPHLFQPCTASEVWVEKLPERRRRMVLEAMANF